MRRQGSHHEDAFSTAVGEAKTYEKSHDGAGCLLREVFERHSMIFAHSIFGNMPTYFGEDGRSSTIDYIGVPKVI